MIRLRARASSLLAAFIFVTSGAGAQERAPPPSADRQAATDLNAPAVLSAKCLTNPLPSTPTGATATFQASDISRANFTAVIWRQPCVHDPKKSVVLMRATPKPGHSAAVCGSDWRIEQGNAIDTMPAWIRSVGIPSVCSDFYAPTTVALDPRNSRLDDQKAFSLSSWRLRVSRVEVAAYTPNLTLRTLTVEMVGSGQGQIVSQAAGIACMAGTCSVAIFQDTPVVLTATPKAGFLFSGWGGACRDAGTATKALVTMTSDATCTARFMPPPVSPETGWWWSPDEPGRGYSLELRNGRLFVASYDYRSDGAATWHLSQGSWDGYALSATLFEYGGGQTIGGLWRQPSERGPVGVVTFRFSTPTRGTLSWSGGRSVAIERFAFAGNRENARSETPAEPAQATDDAVRLQALRDATLSQGLQRVIVRLHGSGVPAAEGRRVEGALAPSGSQIVSTFRSLPMFVAEVTTVGLDALLADPSVAAVHADEFRYTFLADTVPLVGAPRAWSRGHTGKGQRVAVLDTGIESTHPFLAGRVVDEACFTTPIPAIGVRSSCPNGSSSMIGAGSGAPCVSQAAGCYHGTHVAGIVAGGGSGVSGIAPDAQLVSIQVFKILPALFCSRFQPCVGASDSDLIRALEHVRDSAAQLNIVATNLSLGGDSHSNYCDHLPHKPVIDQLRAAGVATIAAAGNAKERGAVAAPACISSVIRVGATTKLDVIPLFSNEWRLPMLLAPGHAVVSSLTGGTFGSLSGTSMSAPHVAGAWAVLRGAAPSADVATILSAVTRAGTAVASSYTGRFYPRLDLGGALESLTQVETGWWWNEAEPGTGYFVEISNGVLFLSAYVYREDGSPVWYVASGSYARGAFQGTLQEYGAGSPPGARMIGDRGTITLQSTGVGSARLTLPSGRQVSLSRFSF